MIEYTLYPIHKADVDWFLYNLVAHFLKARYKLDILSSDEEASAVFQSLDEDSMKNDTGVYHLVFPNEEATVSYSMEVLDKEVIILKPCLPIEHPYAPLIPEFDDEGDLIDTLREEVPMEYFCFSDNSGVIRLEHIHTEESSIFPDILYNGDEFLEALDVLLEFLQQKGIAEIPWFGRLQTVRRMVLCDANELHILHNAGLYDHQSLWGWMKDYGIPLKEIDNVKNQYVSQLKKYAMFVLNRLDWDYGNPIFESDKKERTGLYRKSMTDSQRADVCVELERRERLKRSSIEYSARPSNKPVELKSNNAIIIIMLILFAGVIVAVISLGFSNGDGIAKPVAVSIGMILTILTCRVVAMKGQYKYRHPLKFRYLLVGILVTMPFVFGYLGRKVHRLLEGIVSPVAFFLSFFVVVVFVIVFSFRLRKNQPDERKARPYTLTIWLASMAVIGEFFAFVMAQSEAVS